MDIKQIEVDREPYSHQRLTLLRNASDEIAVRITISVRKEVSLPRFDLCLHSELGDEIAYGQFAIDTPLSPTNPEYTLCFSFLVPDVIGQAFGVSITPLEADEKRRMADRLKLLTFLVPGDCGKKPSFSPIYDIKIYSRDEIMDGKQNGV